jgi:hypothetical protein
MAKDTAHIHKIAILKTAFISDQLSTPPYSALLSAGVLFVNGAAPRSRKAQKNHSGKTG